MKKMMPTLLAAGFVSALIVGMVAAAPAADTGSDVGRVCSACHSVKRICLNLGVKNRTAWKDTVTRMAKNGAQLPLSRVDEFADYLAGLKKGQGPLCR